MTATPAAGHTDIDPLHWTLRRLPAWARPYGRLARWDRPIGVWLLLFPCWWSWALFMPDPRACAAGALAACGGMLAGFALFALGAVAMRGAGCTWNDYLDRDIDAAVERTRGRPLPTGEATPRRALVWAAAQSAVGALVLATFNGFAIAVGLASLLVVAVYPLMKRVTSWPQLVLGFAFNWGALMGDAVANGLVSPAAVALYLGGVAWTLVYDTIYAMQDQRDDAIVGVRSTARRFQFHPKAWLSLFAALTAIGFLAAGWLTGLGPLFHVALLIVAAHLAWQIATVKPHDPADCLRKFKSNRWIGWILLAGILGGRLV
ncbi:MAG: 4-hydroxybenzoate octaprenyltransferase [Rhodospirillales bacterium]|nr:MAG: 4-hydroxybenzoate octaprenyltransferase [Rhodospirillales bacterium]